MKTGIFSLAALAVLQVALAQPHGVQGNHRHHRRQAVVTEIDYVTVVADEVVVYVNEKGEPISTKTVYGSAAPATSSSSSSSSASDSSAASTTLATSTTASTTPTPSLTSTSTTPPPPPPPPTTTTPPAPPPSSAPAPAAPASSPAPAAPAAPAPAPAAPAPAAPAPAQYNQVPASNGGVDFGHGVTYSPYNADGTCKSQSAVAQDLSSLPSFEVVRIYGTDCGQTANVFSALKGKGVKIWAGIFDINQVSKEAQDLIDTFGGNWDMIKAVSVGNELVNTGKASSGQVIAAIGQAKSMLKAAGYSGPVVTVDTFNAIFDHPELCTDFCAMNCHAFFDPNTASSGAGDFVKSWIQKVAGASGKKVIVTESGWPSSGVANGKAVPSTQDQQNAISSIKSAVGSNLILFSSYNNLWKKKEASTMFAEQSWGIFGNSPTS